MKYCTNQKFLNVHKPEGWRARVRNVARTIFGKLSNAMIGILCATLFGFFTHALAADKPVLKAVTADSNFPYNFVKNNQIQGISIDVAHALADRIGYQLTLELVPWTRALYTAKHTKSVMAFSVARIPEREGDYHWIGPIATNEVWLYKLRSRPEISVKKIEDARDFLIGDEASNANIPLLTRFGIKVDTAPSMLSNCRKFKMGRVDLVPFEPEGVAAFLRECGLSMQQVERVILLPRNEGLYIVLGRATPPELIARLQTEFALIVKDKTLVSIKEKWNLRQ